MIKSTLALAAIAAATLATPASATTYNWGSHGALETSGLQVFPLTAGSFSDSYTFTLGSTGAVTGSATDLNIFGADITGGSVSLYKENGAIDSLVGSFSFDNGTITYGFGNLLAGAYYYTVTGTVNSPIGGGYQLNSALAAPVPEPESMALMLAGLGALGISARRRRQPR